MSSQMMTVLGTIAAALGFVLGAIATGQLEVSEPVAVGLGAVNAALAFVLGKTHPGTDPKK